MTPNEEINKKLDKVLNMFEEHKDKTNEIFTAISGNEKLGITGLVKDIKKTNELNEKRFLELEDYKKKDEKLKNKIAGGLAVGTPLFVILWHSIVDYFKNKFL